MSFLDRVTKAVGDVVDRGKKEVDQFVRIQRINGEISEKEKRIVEFKNQIQQARQQVGEKVIELLRTGSLVLPDLQPFVEQVGGFEKQITAEEVEITEKRAEIEKIRAENEAAKAAAAAPTVIPPPPPAAGVDAPVESSAAAPASSVRFCPQCGTQLMRSGAFCPQCGAKTGEVQFRKYHDHPPRHRPGIGRPERLRKYHPIMTLPSSVLHLFVF